MKRIISMLALICMLATSLFTVNRYVFKQPSQPAFTFSAEIPSKAADLDQNQNKIIQQVGKVPYISDVLFDKTTDGKMIVAAVAELGMAQEVDKKSLARNIAKQYTEAVYQTGLPIGQASITITVDNHLILGTSLGEDQQNKMTKSTLTGEGTGEFIQFLKQHENQSSNPEDNTWFYEVE